MIRTCNVIYENSCSFTTGRLIDEAMARYYALESSLRKPLPLPDDPIDTETQHRFLWVDAGHVDVITTPAEQTAYYFIDSYLRSGRDEALLDIARRVKYPIDATVEGSEWFKEHGINVPVLQLGFAEDIFYPEDVEKEYDVCFVGGRQTDGLRHKILDIVSRKYKTFVGGVSLHDYRKTVNKSKVFLDIPPMETTNLMGQRFMEGYGCCANIVTPRRPIVEPIDCNKFYYNFDDLEGSLISAIDEAMEAPPKRYDTSMHSYVAKAAEFERIIFA